MIGEELVPGLPETRRADEGPCGDTVAVSVELVCAWGPAARGAHVRARRRAGAGSDGADRRGARRTAWLGCGARRSGRAVQRVAGGRAAFPAAADPGPAGPVSGAGGDAAARADGAGAARVRRAPAVG